MNVIVIGASRGIGREFTRQYLAEGATVAATGRRDADVAMLVALGANAFVLDVADAASGPALGRRIGNKAFDIAIYCAGAYGQRTSGLETPSETDFDTLMHTNVLGAMRVLPQLAGALAPGAKLAVLSSRMGSIGLRGSTHGWLYRASKAALNSVLKDASIALAGSAICVALHPGWVQTDMGGAQADLTVELSVTDMRRVLARLTANDNGRFLNHDGESLAW